MKRSFFFIFLFYSLTSIAQISIKDSCITIPMVSASFSLQIPSGDLAKRFNNNASAGLSFLIKNKKNWIYGADWNYIFGKNPKENGILDSMTTQDGYIINQNGEYANVRLFERGFYSSLKFGKLFPVLSPNPNSGFFVLAGLGLLQHKIHIEDIGNQTPQLTADYRKGYDRLTNGLALSEFVGYSYFGSNKLVNFFAGVEMIQAWTQSRRSFDYDLRKKDTQHRKDFLNGFRAGWILPLYKRTPQKYYYN
jgi:hypothetical protein